jgi:hypothetical protein
MGFFDDHVVFSTIASLFVLWLVGKAVVLTKDRQRIKKLVGNSRAPSLAVSPRSSSRGQNYLFSTFGLPDPSLIRTLSIR